MTLHPKVAAKHRSSFSTLSGGAPDAVVRRLEKAPVQQQQLPTPSPSPQLRNARTRIPTATLTPSPGRHSHWPNGLVFTFNPVSPRHDRDYGIRFSDVIHHRVDVMQYPGESILSRIPAVTGGMTLKIMWPGYVHMEYAKYVPTTINGAPITRWQLAEQVVGAYERFLQDARRARCSAGNGAWDVNKVRLEQLVLVFFSNNHGHDGIFQATVEIDTHRS